MVRVAVMVAGHLDTDRSVLSQDGLGTLAVTLVGRAGGPIARSISAVLKASEAALIASAAIRPLLNDFSSSAGIARKPACSVFGLRGIHLFYAWVMFYTRNY